VIAAAVGTTDLWVFQVLPADLAHEPGEPINFFAGLSPKCDSRVVRLMTSISREAEERLRLVSASGIEDSPPSARAIARKTKRWQQFAVKLVRTFQIAYAQVKMVEISCLFHFMIFNWSTSQFNRW
jgi:hypothetical protein